MYLLFSLFFISLLGIIVMVGRKLALVKHEPNFGESETFSGEMFFDEVRDAATRGARTYGYAALVGSIRLYVRLTHGAKSQYREMKLELKKLMLKNKKGEEKQNVSKFLTMISDYKQKVRTIKRKVVEEEEAE